MTTNLNDNKNEQETFHTNKERMAGKHLARHGVNFGQRRDVVGNG
jgi:hypothetical protein